MFLVKCFLVILELKKTRALNILFVRNQIFFKFRLLPLHVALLLSIKWFGYKIGIQLNNSPLIEEQNIYVTKTVNTYILYDLDN